MKHYILLSVEIPSQNENAQYSKWLSLARRLEPLAKTTKGIEQLGEGVCSRVYCCGTSEQPEGRDTVSVRG